MKAKALPETITISVNGVTKLVRTADYIAAKTRQLREFGYASLTADHVEAQLVALLVGKPLTVIGMFMQDEVKCRKQSR